MTEGKHRVVHPITTIAGPISSLCLAVIRKDRIISRKQRLTGTVDVGLEEVIGLLEIALPHVIGTPEEKVRPVADHIPRHILSKFRFHPTLLIGNEDLLLRCAAVLVETVADIDLLLVVLHKDKTSCWQVHSQLLLLFPQLVHIGDVDGCVITLSS